MNCSIKIILDIHYHFKYYFITYHRQLSVDIKMQKLKIKTFMLTPKVRDDKNGIYFKIRGTLPNPEDINRFRGHTSKNNSTFLLSIVMASRVKTLAGTVT